MVVITGRCNQGIGDQDIIVARKLNIYRVLFRGRITAFFSVPLEGEGKAVPSAVRLKACWGSCRFRRGSLREGVTSMAAWAEEGEEEERGG